MSKIKFPILHGYAIKKIMYNLTAEQSEIILGGSYPYEFNIMNSTDRAYVNSVDNSVRYDGGGPGSVNQHDNKYNTIDYSRSIHNQFIYI